MSLESVRAKLGEDAKLVTIEKIGDVVKVAFREFQFGEKGKETWNRVNSIVKELGGEWVSNGKLSHWKIPREIEPSETAKHTLGVDKAQKVKDAKEYLRHALENLEAAGY